MLSQWRQTLDAYPAPAREHLLALRLLILEVARQTELPITESIKWGQLSFHCDTGSPLRIGWSPKTPEHYQLFCHCQTSLIDTFRQLYSDQLSFEGNRAINLALNSPIPAAVQHCIALALNYRALRHLPLLGATAHH